MATLHIENTVHDYAAWRAAFDKFERFRRDNGVRRYRVSRHVSDPAQVTVDLDFDSRAEAEAFAVSLQQIWRTPQSQQQLVAHSEPMILEVDERVLA